MTKRQWLNRNVVGVGEAMVEFAPVGQNIYRRGFAGDTLNTCWHIAGWRPASPASARSRLWPARQIRRPSNPYPLWRLGLELCSI